MDNKNKTTDIEEKAEKLMKKYGLNENTIIEITPKGKRKIKTMLLILIFSSITLVIIISLILLKLL